MINNNKQIAIVSGGSRGLGKGIIQNLLSKGYIVATFSRSQSNFIKEITAGNYKEQFYWESIDGTDYQGMDQFIKTVIKKYGHINSLINNVGMAVDGVLTLTQSKDISHIINLNLEGVIRLTQLCVKHMLPKKEGVIINVSSIIGIRGYSGLSIYSATKAGLDGFTRSLARELGPRGIRTNSIAPGYLETEMTNTLSESQLQQIIRRTPLGRLGKIEDIIGVVNFLLSDSARFVTGQTIVVDGGITC